MTRDDSPPEVMWQGKYIRAMRQGQWEYASRCKAMTAVVIYAEIDGAVLLIEQERVPIGMRCIELPAGLVGDEDDHATIEETAAKELREETGYEAERFDMVGEFYSSPGMIAESFTLVRARGLKIVGEGGGNEHEEIVVHLVPKVEIRGFVERMRSRDRAIDVRILALGDFLGAD